MVMSTANMRDKAKVYGAYFDEIMALNQLPNPRMRMQLEDFYYSKFIGTTWDYDGAHPHEVSKSPLQKKARKKPTKPKPKKPKRKPVSGRMAVLEF